MRNKVKKLYAAATALRIAGLGGVIWEIAGFYRLVYVTGWDWQNPIAALPRALPLIILPVVLVAAFVLGDKAEFKAIDIKQRAAVRAAFERAEERRHRA